jgi:energy-coupling factor transporter ATP-binding protein EcfA2
MTKSRSEQIFDHALKFATPFRTTLGHAWAIIPDGAGRYHGWPIASRAFRHWLANSFNQENGIFAGEQALKTAVGMLEARATHSDFPVSEIFTRVGSRGDRRAPQSVLLHLANANRELVEITPNGHYVVSAQSWHFLAGASTEALPRPVLSNVTLRHHLRELLDIHGPALDRAVVWLFAALRPSGPYPVLVLAGPPASGKSTIARTLRNLIDPSATPLLIPPGSQHDLLTLALHNHVLAFDNVSSLPRRIGDSLASVATGGGLGICGQNIFDEPQPLALARPVIVTTPDDYRAFTENAIRVELDSIAPANLRTESAIERQLQLAAPSILGTLCAAVASALANAAASTSAVASRFADVYQWTMSAAPVLGLTPEQINHALAANPIVDAIAALLESQPEWSGTATALLEKFQAMEIENLPANARNLSQQLNATPLSLFGIELERKQTHNEYLIGLRKQTPDSSLRTPTPETASPTTSTT